MKREDLIQEIVESLARCQRLPVAANWKTLGLSRAQAGMLFMLHYHAQVSIKQISDFLGITKSAVTQLLDPLVDKGLVSRQPDPKDRRFVHLSLTPQGLQVLKKLHKLKFAGTRTALESLSSQELSQLAGLHRKMASITQKQTERVK